MKTNDKWKVTVLQMFSNHKTPFIIENEDNPKPSCYLEHVNNVISQPRLIPKHATRDVSFFILFIIGFILGWITRGFF
jgi:hypothetical protein